MALDPYVMVYVLMAANVVLIIVVTAARARAMKRRQQLASRRANSQCVRCGYDLRVHSGRCPECGQPVPPRITRCSFCGKFSRDVGPMVEGPGDVYICANCVELAHGIILTEREKATGVQTPAPQAEHSSATSTPK